jgi:hypothetical protein
MNDPWPITGTYERGWAFSDMSEYLTEHPNGNLVDRAREEIQRRDLDAARVKFYESGCIEVRKTITAKE